MARLQIIEQFNISRNMKTYSLSDARAKFNEIIRRVKTGEQVTITERGKPLALVSRAVIEGTSPEQVMAERGRNS